MADNYGAPNLPSIKRTFLGGRAEERTAITMVGKSSTKFFLGEFVPFGAGTIAAPTIPQYAVDNYQAKQFTGYFVTGFYKSNNTSLPIQDDPSRSGTLTDATAVAPMAYTFPANNDDDAGTSAVRELVELMPIFAGDILEVSLSNDAGTAMVARGTTTAFGSSGSSANMGVGLAVEADAPFALQESSASTTLADLDFVTTRIDDRYPALTNRVYVTPIRPGFGGLVAAIS